MSTVTSPLNFDPEQASPAAISYREQLAQVESALDLGKLVAPLAPKKEDPRVATRKKLTGRARVALDSQIITSGKLVDISLTGVSLLCEDPVPAKKVVMLEIDSYSGGKRFVIVFKAVMVYSILVGGSGQKFGFQFGPLDEKSARALGELLEILG